MATYTATVAWPRGADEPYRDNKYSRGHQWSFDGGVTFRASSLPHVVPRFSETLRPRIVWVGPAPD